VRRSPSSRRSSAGSGTAVTGSDTSANALFATLQQTAAQEAGLDPTLLVAANTSGGVVGKMISPQNLTIAATAVGIVGREADLFRRTIFWSIGLLLVLCVLSTCSPTSWPGCCP
jgi:lactate permease